MLENHNQYGRSMLEMLGVLAVVGMLSVIGIKGFQYAMERHRVNELTEEYISFIQNLLPYETDFVKIKNTKSPEKALYLVPYIRKMNIIPSKWQIFSGNYLRDSIGVLLDPHIRHEPGGIRANKITWNYILKSAETNVPPQRLCEIMYTRIVLPYHELISMVAYFTDETEGDASSISEYGDNYCNGKSRRCITSLTLTDIQDRCSRCADKNKRCLLVISF